MIEMIIAVICMDLSDKYARTGDGNLVKNIKILRVLSIIALVYSVLGAAFFLIYGLSMCFSSVPRALNGDGLSFLAGGTSIFIACIGFSYVPGLVLSIISIAKATKSLKRQVSVQKPIEFVPEELHAYCVDCGSLWRSGSAHCTNCGGRDYMVR